MKVTIYGAGYVGLVTGACLSEVGNDVLCVDVNEDRVAALNRGEIPIYEPGLSKIITKNCEAGCLKFTTDPVEEVRVANEILQVLDLKTVGPTMVSCPSCGRCEIDLYGLADAVEDVMKSTTQPMKVAVMGCVVNGPGEAMDADLGVAGGKGRGVIFRKGEILRTVDEADMLPVLTEEIRKHEIEMAETVEAS